LYQRIDHIGIAVRSVTDALQVYRDGLSLTLEGIEIVEDQGARVALLTVGQSRIELLEATRQDSPIGRFISKRGEGLHHICFQVTSIVEEIARLKAAGLRMIDEVPRCGAEGRLVAFVHPSTTAGVLIELSQVSAEPTNPKK
jgi:methylmalonyl-CoA/ethylmalonyl-CoA epimerase